MLHPIVRWLARRSIRWFYRGAEFVNARAIPASGPVLIVASHGNDLPDILMTFLAINRDVLFVANIAAADSPLVRWTYRGLGVIPVSRVRDARALKARGEDASAINADAFVRVVDALEAGHVVAICPEGNVHDFPHLGRLRTGAAKMALQALERGVRSLTLVPVGYQYENASTPRSGMLGVVGRPVALETWEPTDARRNVTDLTQFIRERLCEVTRNARARDDAETLSMLVATAGAALSNSRTSPLATGHAVQPVLSKLSAADGVFVANAVAPSAVQHTHALEHFQRALSDLNNVCTSFGAQTWSARDCADVLMAAGDVEVHTDAPNALAVCALAPLAAFAWAWQVVPIFVCRAFAVRYAPTAADLAARTLLPGLYIIAGWCTLAPLVLLVIGVTPWIVLVLFLIQPRLGDFAFSWRDRWRTMRLIRRVRNASDDVKLSITKDASEIRTLWSSIVATATSAADGEPRAIPARD